MNTTTALRTANAATLDRAGLVAGRSSWDVRLGLGGILVAVVAAVTLASGTPSSALGAPVEGAATALVRGLHVLASDPASGSLPAPEAVVVADGR
jgi:hypothetical protein